MTLHRFDHLTAAPDVDHDRAETLIEALDRSLSAVSPARLDAAVRVMEQAQERNYLKDAFERADIAGLPQTLLRHCAALRDDTMGIEERLMVLSEMDEDKMIQLAQAGIIAADDALLAVAFNGNTARFDAAWQRLSSTLNADTQTVLDTALSLCAYSHELDNGHSNEVDVKKVAALIALGANVNAHDIWKAVVENAEHDVKVVFIKAGADFGPYFEQIDQDRYSYHYLDGVLKDLAGTPLYTRLGDNILSQTVLTRPLNYSNRITTIYRFDLGRITETQQHGDDKFPPQAMAFADVPLDTLQAMRDKLVALGGNPMSLASSLRTGHAGPVIKPAPSPR